MNTDYQHIMRASRRKHKAVLCGMTVSRFRISSSLAKAHRVLEWFPDRTLCPACQALSELGG